MLDSQQYQHPLIGINQVVSVDELLAAQRAVRDVYLNHDIKNYIVNLVTMSRQHPDVYLGASPRGALALYRTSQARASIAGRDYVVPMTSRRWQKLPWLTGSSLARMRGSKIFHPTALFTAF